MEEEAEEKLFKAGGAVASALKYALEAVNAGVNITELCEELESIIKREGAFPAFPANISVNEVAAHYTGIPGEETVIPEGGVIKVDLGAHIDGYIADGALTISLDKKYVPLLKAAYRALKAAQRALRHGIRLGQVGLVIEREIKSLGFNPISNLTGHKIERYNLHAGKSVPNVATVISRKASEGEVYAVEPFSTDGVGMVVEGRPGGIFRVVSTKRTKNDVLDNMLRDLWREYKSLPFAARWVFASRGSEGLNVLKELEARGRVYQYSVLVERTGGMVAQFEDTFIVRRNNATPLIGVLEIVKL